MSKVSAWTPSKGHVPLSILRFSPGGTQVKEKNRRVWITVILLYVGNVLRVSRWISEMWCDRGVNVTSFTGLLIPL